MTGIKVISLLFLTLVFSNLALAEASSEKEVQQAYYNWCSSIEKAKGKAEEMVQYYAPDAILLPTLSSDILINKHQGLNAYFTQLTSYKNIKCETQRLITRFYGDFVAVNAGFYSFSFLNAGKPKKLLSRFTFVYEKYNSQWLIVSHHSSVKP